MKRMISLFALPLLVLFTALSFSVAPANAFTARSPQVTFDTGPLQSYFTGLGETFNVATDQADVQVWSVNGINTTFTLYLKNGVMDEIGVYNGNEPTPVLFPVFLTGTTDGWFATLHFSAGNLVALLFDNNAVYQGSTTYTGVDCAKFGFYIKSVLTYEGVSHPGDWWVCFQDVTYLPENCAFDSAVLEIQSVHPTPAKPTTWGGLKKLYR
jgi:hypothetical protein